MAISSDLTCVIGEQSHDEVDKDHNIKLEKQSCNNTSADGGGLCGGVEGRKGSKFKSTL